MVWQAKKAAAEKKAAEKKAAEKAQVRSHTGWMRSPSHCERHVLMQVAPTFLFTRGCTEQDPRRAMDRSRARAREALRWGDYRPVMAHASSKRLRCFAVSLFRLLRTGCLA